ncbi:MAG TPA: MoaD/ThiS family protein [Myxococcota bacterium]|nr:MoaD/ThiS family protein [Myxococcota bacterium]
MRIAVASALRSYTGNREHVAASGATVGELLDSLDASYPGIRFRIVDEQERIRVHIRIFVNRELADLRRRVAEDDDVQILCALSGG